MRGLALGVAVLAALLAILPAAQARPESEAPTLRTDVLGAGHEPATVQPHTQWHGFLRLAPGSNVTAVAFQVCRVGQTCFAPPTAATPDGNGTWRFDTTGYTVNGRPVDYEPGWRLGVKWWLTEGGPPANAANATGQATGQTVEFPAGPDLDSDACAGDAAPACAELHYLAFEVAKAPRAAPGPGTGLGATLVLLLAVAVAARR